MMRTLVLLAALAFCACGPASQAGGIPVYTYQIVHIDDHFAGRQRKRAANETFVRVGRRLMPVVPVAVLVFLATGAVLALTA